MSHEFKGHHVMLDIQGVGKRKLAPMQVRNVLHEACYVANLSVLGCVDYEFEPEGYSCVLLLSESHLSAHTWPEHRGVMIDIFTCGEAVPDKAITYIKKWFDGEHCREGVVARGVTESE